MFKALVKFIPSVHQKFIHKQIFNMEHVYFRQIDSAEQFQISFRYENKKYGIDRQFNFDRRVSERLVDCIHRINVNFDKAFAKKSKKKKKESDSEIPTPDINVKMYRNGAEVSEDLTCLEILNNVDGLTMRMIEKEYKVIKNAPWICQIILPSSILANFPVYANKFEILFASIEQCSFTWYTGKVTTDETMQEVFNWAEVGTGFVYYPKNNEIGNKLKVICQPRNSELIGPSAEVISTGFVEAGPGICPFDTRHKFTEEKLYGNSFRVCTYNLLADLYCDSEFTRTELYPYCPPYALNIDYRKQLFLKELLGYNFDVACLQEVDSKIFESDLAPVFASLGYTGDYKKKGKTVSEGLAIFYNKTRFICLNCHSTILGEEIETHDIFKNLWQKIQHNAPLIKRLCDRPNVVQALILESLNVDKELLVVVNTHLYFHPDADHIRLLQAGFAIIWIQNIVNQTKLLHPDKRVSLIFCGDFNSVPNCGIYQLMTTKFVPDNLIDWSSNTEEAVQGVTLSQPYELASACGTPQYTNFTSGFADCLDYVFYQNDNLEVKQVVPLPSNEELQMNTALPSFVFPSDHIALVADIQWK